MTSALHSNYVIDGVPQELTPAQILGNCGCPVPCAGEPCDPVVDENCEPGLDAIRFETYDPEVYLEKILKTKRKLPVAFAGNFTRGRIAGAILDTIGLAGHFKIGDLALAFSWSLDMSGVGNMAAFYHSVEAAGDYLGDLGLEMDRFELSEGEECSLEVRACLARNDAPEDIFVDQPYRSMSPVMGASGIPGVLDADPQSWLVYIPFDTADYRLGGSMFAQATGQKGGVDPLIQDADYFIDCFEVVRELVEDGVAVAAATVLDGGLLTAVERMTKGGTGVSVDISDMIRAFKEKNVIRLLFAEIPGVLIQVRDSDFDYVDAELLLQDVAYFPLGHPLDNGGKVCLKSSAKTGLQNILESLIRNQGGEGED